MLDEEPSCSMLTSGLPEEGQEEASELHPTGKHARHSEPGEVLLACFACEGSSTWQGMRCLVHTDSMMSVIVVSACFCCSRVNA
jgi:hypothetical protein